MTVQPFAKEKGRSPEELVNFGVMHLMMYELERKVALWKKWLDGGSGGPLGQEIQKLVNNLAYYETCALAARKERMRYQRLRSKASSRRASSSRARTAAGTTGKKPSPNARASSPKKTKRSRTSTK